MFTSRGHCCYWSTLAAVLALVAVLGGTSTAYAQLTAADIQALREQGEREGWTFEVAENEATAYPLSQLCGFFQPEGWEDLTHWDPGMATRDLPAYFDWRDVDGCTPVKNQASCGSCWAFATVGPLECNIKIKDGITVNLSEQWLVSCNTDGWGCDGGFMAHMYHQWKTDPCGGTGAVMESYFPYVAYDASCNCPYPHEYLIDSWAYIGGGTAGMKQAILDYGPISVGVYANSAMQAYDGGIFNGCQSYSCNHAVVLVGWDDNQGGGVWFMRNSWGTGWGEDGGYMRIPYGCSNIGDSACYVVYGGTVPSLAFEYPDGLPDMVDPGVETRIRVNVLPDEGTPVPDSGRIHRSKNGAGYFIEWMDVVGTNQYEGVLPAADCFDHWNFYFSVEESGGEEVYDPSYAPATVYSTVVATGYSVLLDDNFETNQGWSVYSGADTGNWERANPEQVVSGDTITQPENDHSASGTLCYVTGAAAGSGAGSYDVDGGPTRLTSPVLNLAGGDATVSYWRWYHISTEWDDQLLVRISNDNGASWTTVEAVSDRAEWTYVEWRVSDYVTPTSQVQVRFVADDSPNNSLVEALVDDVRIDALDCEQSDYTLTVNVDGQGVVVKDPDQATYGHGATVELQVYAYPGWTFDHWSGDLGGSDNPAYIYMDGNKAVTAHLTQDQYTLSISVDGSGSVTKDPDQATYTYDQVVELTANPDPGWTFDHWSGALSGSNNPEQITITGDETVVAHFTQEQYTLAVTVGGNGSVTKDPDQATYTYNQVVELTANADPGWEFDHWSGDLGGSDNPDQITMTGDAAVTAHFTETADDCPEDLNGDEHIGLEDLSALLANYGQTGAEPEDGDFNGDGVVNIEDLSQLLAVYSQDCPTR
jgi:hypothetical protein